MVNLSLDMAVRELFTVVLIRHHGRMVGLLCWMYCTLTYILCMCTILSHFRASQNCANAHQIVSTQCLHLVMIYLTGSFKMVQCTSVNVSRCRKIRSARLCGTFWQNGDHWNQLDGMVNRNCW